MTHETNMTHSLAAFRRSQQHDDLARLAGTHLREDLDAGDRDVLRQASSRVSRDAVIGSLLGIGLGVWAAVKLRRVRADVLSALRATERPVKVVFADGRTGELARSFSPPPTLGRNRGKALTAFREQSQSPMSRP